MDQTSDANLGMHILEVEITTKCNLNCKHCYNRNFKPVDLPLETIKDLYRFADRNDVWTFTISGGEAILHSEFDKLVDFITNTPHKFRLVLQSNGTLLKERLWDKLRIFDLVHLSFDPVEDVRLHGSANLKLAEDMRRAGINNYVFSTIHRKNRHLIDQMVEAAKSANVPIGFNICIPVERLDPSFLMTREEFMDTEKHLNELFLKGDILRYTSPLVSLLDESKKGDFDGIHGGCTAGVGACVIGPSGECYPCPFFRVSAGNIFETPLEKIWSDSELFNKIRQRQDFDEPCRNCERLAHCGGCRNRAYRLTGELTGADPMCYKDLM